MREKEGDLHSAVNLYIKAGLPAKAARLVTQHPVRQYMYISSTYSRCTCTTVADPS